MSLKEKYLQGNNFILSPRGKISRVRYILYAFVFEFIYRLIMFIGNPFVMDISPIFLVVGFFLITVIILKLFNYKKRAYSFLNNNFFAYLYSILYLCIGCFVQSYVFFLQLANKKNMYELTHNSLFEQYATLNIPDFVTSSFCHIIFYLTCALGIVMFLFLLFKPAVNKTTINTNEVKENFFYNILKINNFRKVIIIPSIILYLIFVGVSYSEIHWRAYNWMYYFMSNEQVDYANNIKRVKYEKDLADYNKAQQEWNDCLRKYQDIGDRMIYCKMSPRINTKPDIPYYFTYDTGYMGLICLKYFNCTTEKFSLFSDKCGDIKFNNVNRKYGDGNFYPYLLLTFAIILLFPLCICICLLLEKILVIFVNAIKTVNIKKLKLNIKSNPNKKSDLTNKLQELNSLKEQGLITEEDYNKKKDELLKYFH